MTHAVHKRRNEPRLFPTWLFLLLRPLEVNTVSTVTGGIRDFAKLKDKLQGDKKKAEQVLKRTMSDIRSRAPGWIASEIVEVYGIKKSDITKKTAGTVKVTGERVFDAKIIYKGRVLTPTHFGMTPKHPGKNAYTLKASILKGEKKTLGKVKKLTKKQRANLAKNFTRSGTKSSDHSPIMLMRTGNIYIPFQRKSTNRKDVEAIKTISLPQMVSSMRTAPQIQQAINDGLEKRLDHHMKLLRK